MCEAREEEEDEGNAEEPCDPTLGAIRFKARKLMGEHGNILPPNPQPPSTAWTFSFFTWTIMSP